MTITLRPYQEEALERTARAEQRGVRRQLGVAATGLGKAQPVDEPVLTPNGWVPIGSIREGDFVIGSEGKPTRVKGVFYQGRRPIVAVEFSDGAIVRCDREHLWSVRDKHDVHHDRPWRTMTAADIAGSIRRRWRVPIVEPVRNDTFWPLPIDPYLLGILLGDGGLSVAGRVMIHTEHELMASIELPFPCTATLNGGGDIAGSYIIGGDVGRGSNPVLTAIRGLGLEGATSKTKRVPWRYMHADADDRLALLRGIMDADGHVRPSDNHVEITLANEGLIDDVAALVRSLGGTARKTSKATSWSHRGERRSGVAWRLSIAMAECPFRWKADRWRPRTKYQPVRHIESVIDIGDEFCVCISVEASDSLYVTTNYVLTHNTVLFVSLARRRGRRTLILAHRDELIAQAAAQVRLVWPDADIGIVKADRDEHQAQVVVASVQTLSRPARLAAITGPDGGMFGAASEPFDLVVVDEAHHAAADSYRAILAAVNAGADDGPLLLGVTATPDRGDGAGLDDVFDEIVWTYDIQWGIRSGFLADVRGLRISIPTLDLSQVKQSRGDYQAGASGAALIDADAPEHIVAAWREHAADRRTIVFAPTVASAEAVRDAFLIADVQASMVSGETPADERRQRLAAFAEGEIQVMVNCMVLTEGYDNPRADCIVVARPTRSRALYTQMVGRGTRRHPDKRDLLVLDVVGVTDTLSLCTVPSLFGVPPDSEFAAALGDGSMAATAAADAYDQHLVSIGQMKAEQAELFRKMRGEGIAWVPVGSTRDAFVCSLGDQGAVWVAADAAGWMAWLAPKEPGLPARTLIAEASEETAVGVAEDFIRKTGARGLVDAAAGWRNAAPTPKQRRLAVSLGVFVPGMTKGECSDAISAKFAERDLAKLRKAGSG